MGLKAKLRLSNPWTQNFISGIILSLTVGIYLAILGLGAGGAQPSSAHVTTTAYATLYAVFTVTGFFGGSVMNTVGPRWTMALGASGYSVFVGGLWYFDISGHPWFALLGGVILGISAGLLWTVAGYIQFAYAEEKYKGSYIAWQLFLLSVGCAVGALVVFCITKDVTTLSGVPTSVYITFIVIMASAVLVSLVCILPSAKIVREDGTRLAHFTASDFRTEIQGCLVLLKDIRVMLLIVPMAATEMSSALIPTLTAHAFNLRTRSLSALINWTIQIPSTLLFGLVLDNKKYARRVRGAMGLSISCVIVLVGWGLALGFQIKYDIKRDITSPGWDWTSKPYIEYIFVVLFTGIAYAIDQMMVMWVMSALSNEPKLLARYGGFFKGMLSAGLAIAFGQEAGGVSYL
ncbi:membrane transporter [Talaromyces proteolyticus]|uniref:Membrane transporter n=1 Tax=Talaromyces proteolyticus TaxID=1131652 RepID=A0AAD4PZS2_9EURO|nr:membrane transporter [Talaromyces proteolyticus]KAH8696173.1 membrane transporter [Talaromyces proteolyticus]